MSRFGRHSLRAQVQLERQTEVTFTWKGTEYPCVANEAASSKVFGEGGFSLEADLTLFVRIGALPEVPEPKRATVIYRGNKYNVDDQALLPGDEILKLVCNRPDKGV